MERLTRKKKRRAGYGGRHPTEYTSGHTKQEVVGRLAAYEDTGLTPEEVSVQLDLLRKYSEAADGIGVKRLRELAQAEKDGRLVVLPLEAKEGDPTPQCFYGDGGLCPGLSAPNDDEPIEKCKRCWYCSCGYRQEAEEALREETNGESRK